MEAEDHAGHPLSESGLSGWPSTETITQFWAVKRGSRWQLMMAERTGMNYEEFEIMGRLVSEQTALMWLSNTEELMS